MTTPSPTLAARLDYLCSRYVTTQDTPLMWEAERIMFHAYRSGQLITTTEADERVKAAVLAERESILAEVDDIRARYAPIGSKEWSLLSRIRAVIRWRGYPMPPMSACESKSAPTA